MPLYQKCLMVRKQIRPIKPNHFLILKNRFEGNVQSGVILHNTCSRESLIMWGITLGKTPQFCLISWCGNFAEKHSFCIVSGDLSETMQKLCLSAKFPLKEIRWNYGILHSVSKSASSWSLLDCSPHDMTVDPFPAIANSISFFFRYVCNFVAKKSTTALFLYEIKFLLNLDR